MTDSRCDLDEQSLSVTTPDDPYLYYTTIEASGDVLPVTYGIICWSIGNEVIERKDIRVVTTARHLKQFGIRPSDYYQHAASYANHSFYFAIFNTGASLLQGCGRLTHGGDVEVLLSLVVSNKNT